MNVKNKIGMSVLGAAVVAATVISSWAAEVPCHNLSGEHGEGYQVVAYDAASKTWTILRTVTLDGTPLVKRIIVGCRTHKYGDGEALQGRDFCSLQVGRLYGWKSCDNGDIEMVDENFKTEPPTLVITEGRGSEPNYETQVFAILRYEALPDR
jgi:hypothetical protein